MTSTSGISDRPDSDLGKLVKEALEDVVKKRGKVNILMAGRTGVGKSTLVNAVFQGDFAKTGHGRPVTKNVREITKEGIPLSIIDTRGLEMADFEATVEALEQEVKTRNRVDDPSSHVHIGWVCISEDSRRVEPGESALAETLSRHFPVVCVITKARSDNGFRAEVQRLLPEVKNVVRVRALHEQLDDGHSLSPMGLVDLVRLTNELVPEGQRNALAAAQKVDIDGKKLRAHGLVAGTAAAAAAVGLSPIPFSDAFILVPIQIGLLAGITGVFGLPLSKGFLMTLVSSAAGCTAATFLGRTLVANLLKFIPGLGTAAGATISATTAAAFTTALGEAYIAVLARLCGQKDMSLITEDEIAEAFKKELTFRTKKT